MKDVGRPPLSVPEFATSLRVTQSGVRRWILERRIAYIKIGRLVRIPVSELERVLTEGHRPRRERG